MPLVDSISTVKIYTRIYIKKKSNEIREKACGTQGKNLNESNPKRIDISRNKSFN